MIKIPKIHSSNFFTVTLYFILFSISQAIFAFNVTPNVLEMSSGGKFSRTGLRVINDSKKPLPIEMVISRIEISENGEPSKQEAGEEFLVFPPQAMIATGASQNFRVQWVGEVDLKKSQHYLFSINQIPVKMTATEGKEVEIVFNYQLIVNVAPTEGTSELKLVKAEIAKDSEGILRPVLTIRNSKNIHARISDANIQLSAGDWSKKLSSTYLAQILGVGVVSAGKTRLFVLNVDIPNTLTNLGATIDYKSR